MSGLNTGGVNTPPTIPNFNYTPNLSFPSSYTPPSFTNNTPFGSFTTGLTGGNTSYTPNTSGLSGFTYNKYNPLSSLSNLIKIPKWSANSNGTSGSVATGAKGGNGGNGGKGLTKAQVGQGLGVAADIGQGLLTSIAGPKMGSDGPNAGLTQGIDSAYNSVSDAVMKVNPLAGGIMKAAGLTGNIINSVGGGTDGMTKIDGVLNSAPMTLLTLGLNGFLGDKSETMTKDSEAFDQVGSSYGGTGDLVEDALSKAGKKYGLLSGGARDKANALIRKAKAQQGIMSNIASSTQDSFAIQSSMSNIKNNRRANQLQGGYNQAAVRVGRQGLKIKRIASAYNMMVKLQKGGKPTDPYQEFIKSFPKGSEGLYNTDDFAMQDYWEFNGKPKDFDEAVSKEMFIQQPNGWYVNPTEYFKYAKGKRTDNPISKQEGGSLNSQVLPEYFNGPNIEHLAQRMNTGQWNDWDTEMADGQPKPSKFQEGGTIKKENIEYKPENVSDIIKFVNKHNKVNFVQRLRDSFRETIPDWEGNKVATHKLAVELDRGKVKLFPMVQEIDGKLYDFTDPKNNHENPVRDALDMSEKNGDVVIFNNLDDAVWFSKNYKQYYPTFGDYTEEPHLKYDKKQNKYIFTYPKDHRATISELEWYNSNDPKAIEFRKRYKYNEGTNEYLPTLIDFKEDGKQQKSDTVVKGVVPKTTFEFKSGGSFNVIPEGALHARKHNMEVEGITPKGIPVVSQAEGGELEQQAEIEREEIIFRLEVTKKLEDLLQEYSDDKNSQSEKDKVAIEAGKLLVQEILYNTKDNTNNLI